MVERCLQNAIAAKNIWPTVIAGDFFLLSLSSVLFFFFSIFESGRLLEKFFHFAVTLLNIEVTLMSLISGILKNEKF